MDSDERHRSPKLKFPSVMAWMTFLILFGLLLVGVLIAFYKLGGKLFSLLFT